MSIYTHLFLSHHFSAGVGRTGVFCALSILIERLKTEHVIDVFQTVKMLRQKRPAMVQTKVCPLLTCSPKSSNTNFFVNMTFHHLLIPNKDDLCNLILGHCRF